MKTKVIKLPTPQLREDLTYVKYYRSEKLTYELRDSPELFDVEKELAELRNQAISQSVGGNIISISSKQVPGETDFIPLEEITITYEELKV